MTKTFFTCLAPSALGLCLTMSLVGVAFAQTLPTGVFARFDGSDPAAPAVAANLQTNCMAQPTVVYPDGLVAGRRSGDRDSVMAGGPYYRTQEFFQCASGTGDDTLACEGGRGTPEDAGPRAPLALRLASHDGGAFTLCMAGGSPCFTYVACDVGRYDMNGPDGRNILDELLMRGDGGAVFNPRG